MTQATKLYNPSLLVNEHPWESLVAVARVFSILAVPPIVRLGCIVRLSVIDSGVRGRTINTAGEFMSANVAQYPTGSELPHTPDLGACH